MVFKVKRLRNLVVSAAVISALLVSSNQVATALGPIKLDVKSVDTPAFLVQGDNGQRGAALAQLSDGRLLIGGGKNGFTLFLYEIASNTQTLLGQVASAAERLNDSRFAVTDIAVLSEVNNDFSLLISYPRYDRVKKCVSVVMYQYQLNLVASPTLTKGKLWFASKPCVPVNEVQHAAGRIEVINKTSAYLTVGDLGFTKIANRSARGDLGSVFKVSAGSATKSKVERISQGHRNQQGILLIGNDLYVSEHGPRGGDELNLISKGKDYGWPAVTYGEPYSSGDYVRPRTTGSHEGFTKPLYNWVPSVAPTELIQLPTGNSWGQWAGQLVMGTLREESLIFIQLRSRASVGEVIKVDVNERIRDLEMGKNNQIIATTDTGQLLFISMAK
jgi:glucose/arabinose dehydrogenase